MFVSNSSAKLIKIFHIRNFFTDKMKIFFVLPSKHAKNAMIAPFFYGKLWFTDGA